MNSNLSFNFEFKRNKNYKNLVYIKFMNFIVPVVRLWTRIFGENSQLMVQTEQNDFTARDDGNNGCKWINDQARIIIWYWTRYERLIIDDDCDWSEWNWFWQMITWTPFCNWSSFFTYNNPEISLIVAWNTLNAHKL